MFPLDDVSLSDVGETLRPVRQTEPLFAMLPDTYAAVLQVANGFSVNQGMNRIFGLRVDRYMDLRTWNEEAGWRFAWQGRADSYLFFGETAFGDQYALRWRPDGEGFEESIYLLDANLLSPEIVADSFDDFLGKEIVRNSRAPHDPLAVEALERFGWVETFHNLILTPSLMLGGQESVENLMPLDGFAAMTYGGDIYTAVSSAADGATVAAVEPWTDELGRQRLMIVWAE